MCVDGIVSYFLEGSQKVVYLRYMGFLVEGQRYRSKKFYNSFDGRPELHSAPAKRDGHYVLDMVWTMNPGHLWEKEERWKEEKER